MKKGLKITLLSVLGLVIVSGVLVWMEFGALIKGANSCVKLDDRLYYMEYKGDDGFDGLIAKGGFEKADDMVGYIIEFLSKGHYKPEVETSKEPYGCSALTVKTPDGSVMMGRNFDFPSAIGLIMHCIPDKGYETITTFNVEFYNFGEDFKPEGFKNQYMCLSGLFVALDGINEKGLAIADLMAGDSIETHQRTSKPDLTTTAAISYMLKNAANVDEALKLLESIDMHSDIGAAHHYAMADVSGRSVVVEYVDNKKGGINSCDIPFCEDIRQFQDKYSVLTRSASDSCESSFVDDAMVIGTSAMIATELDCIVNQYTDKFCNPMVMWGKYRKGWFKTSLPISFQFHHVQMDGGHGAKFLELLQHTINNLT